MKMPEKKDPSKAGDIFKSFLTVPKSKKKKRKACYIQLKYDTYGKRIYSSKKYGRRNQKRINCSKGVA